MMRKTERVCLMYLPRFRGYRSEVKAKTRVARSVPTTLQTRLLLSVLCSLQISNVTHTRSRDLDRPP
jgi:hypothetical protein